MKICWKTVAAFYLVMALINGMAISRSIPALNWMGGVYYGAVWPLWAIGDMLGVTFLPIPQWLFTFK